MNNTVRALSVSLILILSSLAGCLSDESKTVEEDSNLIDDALVINYGTVMVSTYHVGELVKAVAGDSVTLEYMSQDNIPVHDYEPSAADLIRLQNSDVFFYHGLGLEPWVESTLSSLGDNAPPSYMTHTMPTGQSDLAYESMLISDLCELMSDGPFESTTLGMMSEDHHDGHDEDDHDEDDHDEDDHDEDGHDEDGHDEHDDGHEHSEAEMKFENPEACPADTNIQVFHMEEGKHILEFESEHDEAFNMAVLKMLGGHAHHDHHGHDDHGDDHDEDNHDEDGHDEDGHDEDGHDEDDGHGDEHGHGMCHNTETHENYEATEEDCEAAGHMWMEDDDHGDEHGHGMCHNTENHENYEATEEDCEAAGHVWMEHDDHDLPEIHAELVAHTLSFPEEMVCYDMNTHTVNMTLTTESDCQDAGFMWTAADSGPGGDDHSDEDHHSVGAVVIHIEAEGDYGFALPNDIEFFIVRGEGGHDDHDGHDDHGDGDSDDHDSHDDEITAEDGEDVFTFDPHSWLSPMAFRAQLNLVLDAMSSTFPDGSSSFNTNANNYSNQLMDLHISYVAAFGDEGTCAMAGQDKTIVANHNAYSYMSVAYDIEIISLHGLDPEGEPSPADIAEVVEHINEEGITVLFVEEYTDQTAVNSIVSETGVSVEKLYTMEMAPSDSSDDYLSMMNKNLENIISGCGC